MAFEKLLIKMENQSCEGATYIENDYINGLLQKPFKRPTFIFFLSLGNIGLLEG